MKHVIIGGPPLSLEDFEAVATGVAGLALASDGTATARVRGSFELNRRLTESGQPVYGVTTGPGHSVDTQIGADRARQMQANFVRFLGCGVGDYLPEIDCRAAVIARIVCLSRGYSGVRPGLIERLVELLEHDIVPCIPQLGSVGASGDLIPASYIAAVVMGEREAYHRGRVRPTAEVYRETGLTPMTLEPKEGLALVNGTNVMTGVGILAVEAAYRLAVVADACTAMTVEALTGLAEPFEAFLHETAKPHPGQIASASRIRRMLSGSRLARSYGNTVDDLGVLERGNRLLAVELQDGYSVRCAPQCIGALHDVIRWVQGTLIVELNSANDNPLYDPDLERVHSGGNFSGFHVGLAMDTLKTAVASVADLVDRQFQLVNDEKYNRGLGVCCRHPLPEDHPDAGIHYGFKGMQLAISALTAEALNMCTPATAFSRSTACHNQDKVSMATIAARQARRVIDLTEHALAIHLLILAQAADLRGVDQMAAGTRRIYDAVRRVSDYLERDRELAPDISRVHALIKSGQMAAMVDVAPVDGPADG